MKYETPAWVKDYADPEMLDWYIRALEVVEVHSVANIEEMTQEEFEEHNKIGVILLKTFTEHHIYIGSIIREHGNPKEIADYEKSLRTMADSMQSAREEPHN